MQTDLKDILKRTFIIICLFSRFVVNGQPCTPAGNQTTYGINDTWIGYVYSGTNFNTYRGYVTAGTAGNYAFDQNFGGSNVTYATNGCAITTELFSVRYKLTKTFTNQNMQFSVSGDDGFRLSIDGGATWLVNRWNDQGYTTVTGSAFMNGTYNLVLEYYENSGDNRITFSSSLICTGAGDPSVYGTNNVWRAYVFQGMNFDAYKGFKTEGSAFDPNFSENFGGDNVTMNWLTCPINTEAFSARLRLTKTMSAGTYVFTVGADDGYRFSLDGGITWVINRWNDQSYNITTYTTTLNGTYNMVIEYYENGGQNSLSFTMSANLLPVKLTSFNATAVGADKIQLNWKSQSETNFEKYIVQKSNDGRSFTDILMVAAKTGNNTENSYQAIDQIKTSGVFYYRLAMKDLDGSITYSSVVSVNIKKIAETKLYPTLVTGQNIFLESPSAIEKAIVEVYDMNGRVLSSKISAISYGKQEIYLPKVITGTYVVKISDQQGTVVSKMISVR